MRAPYSRTLADLLFEQAERHGDAPALICGDRATSYADLADHSGRIAAGLRRLGVRRGDRVGVLINNRAEWLEAFFGASILGAVVVAFSTWSKRDELAWLLRDAELRTLITLDRFGDQHFAADLQALLPDPDCPGLRDVVVLGESAGEPFKSYADLAGTEPIGPLPPGEGPSAADDAIAIYTSGSSSRPKSVPLAHYGIIENGFNIGERQGYRPGERVLLAPPLFWSFGCANAMSAVLTHGGTLVLQPRFDAGEAIALIERHRCSALYTLPSITAAIIAHPEFQPKRVASLRTGLTIGSPQDVMTAATILGAAEICNVYGQTESYGNCCVTPHDWPLQHRSECQGPPLPGVRIRIIHPETGAMLPPNEVGLIEVSGYILRGYLGSSAGQDETVLTADGFFRTGDSGLLNEEEHLVFAGRVSEMIKKGGINIAPAEIEDVLMRHPAVAQVGVVGVADRQQGELLAAFVVAKPGVALTPDELATHCRTVSSRYKVPDFIEIRDTLPVTATGKLMRRDLKQMASVLSREAQA
ncbi:class I adenylate-forming enzyme family protein [Rhodopila sp.]|uniref:class I adenylate-forming enzyme family protein n=1 Tax=Rhodopila sp. TaxID=2480087 RepID=UPI003D1057D7